MRIVKQIFCVWLHGREWWKDMVESNRSILKEERKEIGEMKAVLSSRSDVLYPELLKEFALQIVCDGYNLCNC